MKLPIKLLSGLLIIFLFIQESKAQIYTKGDYLIDANYGWPNLSGIAVKNGFNKLEALRFINTNSFGPVGVKGEYLLSEKIGVGLHVNYANVTASAQFAREDENGNTINYDYRAILSKLRIMPTVNVHMGSSQKLDPYFSFGLGYGRTKFRGKTDDPVLKDVKVPIPLRLYPVAGRVEFGLRYFFTENLGAHAALGISGGALLAAGLSAKF